MPFIHSVPQDLRLRLHMVSDRLDDSPLSARTQYVGLLILLLAAACLRLVLWNVDVEHFDEGVYASNLWFEAKDGYAYPDRHLYAPPLVPWLVEWSIVFFGSAPAGVMAIGLAAGIATVGTGWWLARRWFGRNAGWTAAILVAGLDLHIAYSRTCLTDVTLGLWWMLTLGLLHAAVIRGNIRVGIAAGAATALAWWTKYNGWMPLVLGSAGVAAWLVRSKASRDIVRQTVMIVASAAGTAALLWSPVWWGLQDQGGYSAVARNHVRYFSGLAGWIDGVVRHAGNLKIHESLVGREAICILGLLPLLTLASAAVRATIWAKIHRGLLLHTSPDEGPADAGSGADDARGSAPQFAIAARCALVVAAAMLLTAAWMSANWGPGPLLFIMSTAGVGLAIHAHFRPATPVLPLADSRRGASRRAQSIEAAPPARSDLEPHRTALGAWMLAAWFVGMTLLTPLYRPYPRLLLPWLLSAGLSIEALSHCAAGWISEVSSRVGGVPWERGRGRCVLLAVVAVAMVGWPWRPLGVPRLDRTGLAQAVTELTARAKDAARERTRRDDLAVYVYAEPAAFYHLAAAGVLAGPAGNLKFAAPTADRLPVPTFLIVGPHARRTPEFAAEWERVRSAFEPVAAATFRPSLIVLLDHHSPDEVAAASEPITETLELYRLK